MPGAGPGAAADAAPDPAALAAPDPGVAARTTPGMVCAHHHLYSALARGMPAPPRTPTEFLEILELVWWRLDRALDLDIIEWSAKLGALEALESGTTAIIDHHESPNAIDGSLDVIAAACAEVGVRVDCAYGVTDRHGSAGRPGRAGRERPVPAGRRPGPCGGARRLHLLRRHAGGRRRAGRRPRHRRPHPRERGPGRPRGRGPPGVAGPRRLAGGPRRSPRPRPAGGDRPQPPLQHEQRGRLRPARGPAQPGGARHRRDRRGHARRVPGGLRAPSRGRRDRHPRDGLGLAGDRLAAVPGGPRRHGGVVVRPHGRLVAGVHHRRAGYST